MKKKSISNMSRSITKEFAIFLTLPLVMLLVAVFSIWAVAVQKISFHYFIAITGCCFLLFILHVIISALYIKKKALTEEIKDEKMIR